MSKFFNTIGILMTGLGTFFIAYQLNTLNELSKKTLEQISNEDKLALRDMDTKLDTLLKKVESSWVIEKSKS